MTLPVCNCVGPGHEEGRCMCQFHAEYRPDGTSGILWLSQSNSLRNLLSRNFKFGRLVEPQREESQSNLIMRTFEDIYDSCAAYNMRYCAITGFISHSGNYFTHAANDVANMICFFLANSVVFLMIASKTIVHMLFVFLMILRWITRVLSRNTDTNEEYASSCRAHMHHRGQYYYNYFSRPITNNFLTHDPRAGKCNDKGL